MFFCTIIKDIDKLYIFQNYMIIHVNTEVLTTRLVIWKFEFHHGDSNFWHGVIKRYWSISTECVPLSHWIIINYRKLFKPSGILVLSNNFAVCPYKRGTKDTKGTVKLINLKKKKEKLTTPWLKMKKTNRKTIIHTTQHEKLKNKHFRQFGYSLGLSFGHMAPNVSAYFLYISEFQIHMFERSWWLLIRKSG